MNSLPELLKADPAMMKRWKSASSPIMREIALMAIVKKVRQKDLAAKAGVSASNLIEHFKTKHPRDSTIAAYAAALGMTEQHLTLARGSWAMSETELSHWGERIQADWDWAKYQLVPGTWDKLRAALYPLDNVSRRALDEYALAECRGVSIHGDAGLPNWWSPGIKALAYALRHRFDLSTQLRKAAPAGGFLWGLWLELQHQVFDEADRDAVIKVVTAILRGRNVDVESMEDALEQKKGEFYAELRRHDVISRQKKSSKIVESRRDGPKRRKGRKAP
jgi:transcriptional regulator with XRE-family HTH domain